MFGYVGKNRTPGVLDRKHCREREREKEGGGERGGREREVKRERERRKDREKEREGRERERKRERERENQRYSVSNDFVCLVGFLTSSSTTRLYRGLGPKTDV